MLFSSKLLGPTAQLSASNYPVEESAKLEWIQSERHYS